MSRGSFYSLSVAAALALSGTASAHLIMKTPTPYGNPDNSPLSSSGANYPCKVTGNPATFYSGTDATEMAIGVDQTLSFTGSAVHGGGSCQLAITTDKQPSASTTWQVIESIEGGCPTKDGTSLSEYTYQIPSGTAAGDYVFAWTWISKLAGQPEYYMNCAPIKVTGGSSKREMTKDIATRDNVPNLFVANLANINSCKTTPGTDPTFPDPGTLVLKPNTAAKYANVAGTNCFPAGGTDSGSGSGATTSAAETAAPTTISATATAAETTAPPTTTTASGFITSITTAGSATTTPGGGFVTATASSSAAVATSSSTPGGSTGGLAGACTSEGIFNCIGGSRYQRCASGAWTALQAMPAGTTCTEGQSTTLWARKVRSIFRGRRSI